MIRKQFENAERNWNMAKKYGTKNSESLKQGARSSVGRAPQWHGAVSQKRPSLKSKINFETEAEVIEIPDGWEPVPAMRMVEGRPFLYRVLRKITPKRLENDLKARKSRARSA